MKPFFEELDYRQTPMGELILQHRRVLSLKGKEVYEVKLNGEYLMSSLFYEAEVALADIALQKLSGSGWDVAVGGLGLGYTAAAALQYGQVSHLVVIEALAPVIEWHERGLVPNSDVLRRDERCVFYNADFFALARQNGFDPEIPDRRFDAILVDIDHSPDFLLHESHGGFYSPGGLQRIQSFLKPGGVFALWSNDAPEDDFRRVLSDVFDSAEGHVITFDNPLQATTSENGIYLALKA